MAPNMSHAHDRAAGGGAPAHPWVRLHTRCGGRDGYSGAAAAVVDSPTVSDPHASMTNIVTRQPRYEEKRT